MTRQLESLDLNLVNVLYWILVEGSVTAAGDRLGLSQPAVSRALGRLRDMYNDPLMVKQGRRLVPTPLGESLLPLAAQAVEALRHVANAGGGFDPATSTGAFRIALKDALGVRLLDLWEAVIKPHAPGLTLDFVDLSPSIVSDVVSGKIDLVFMPQGEDVDIPDSVDLTQFVIRPICSDPYVTCLRADHPLVRGGRNHPLTLEEYLELDHILINPGGGERSSIDTVLAERGFERNIAYRSQGFLLAKSILRRTDCALTACHCLIGEAEQEFWISRPPVEVSPLQIHVGWHPNWTLNPRHKWVRERLIAGISEPLTLDKVA